VGIVVSFGYININQLVVNDKNIYDEINWGSILYGFNLGTKKPYPWERFNRINGLKGLIVQPAASLLIGLRPVEFWLLAR